MVTENRSEIVLFPQRCDTNDKLKGYVVRMVEIRNNKLVLNVRMWVLVCIIQPWGLFYTLHFLVYSIEGMFMLLSFLACHFICQLCFINCVTVNRGVIVMG
jgi:hypothetical protein